MIGKPTLADFDAAMRLMPEDAAQDTPDTAALRRVLTYALGAAQVGQALRATLDPLNAALALAEA